MNIKDSAKIIIDTSKNLIEAQQKVIELKHIQNMSWKTIGDINNLLHKMIFYAQKAKVAKTYTIVNGYYGEKEVRLSDTFGLRYKNKQSRVSLHEFETAIVGDVLLIKKNGNRNMSISIPISIFNQEMIENFVKLHNASTVSRDDNRQIRKEVVISDTQVVIVSPSYISINNINEDTKDKSYGYKSDYSRILEGAHSMLLTLDYALSYDHSKKDGLQQAYDEFNQIATMADIIIDNFDKIKEALLIAQGEIESKKKEIENAIAPYLAIELIKGKK